MIISPLLVFNKITIFLQLSYIFRHQEIDSYYRYARRNQYFNLQIKNVNINSL
ncbi:hypothetical protein pb186bvf_008032 [Paramecium bursaria]